MIQVETTQPLPRSGVRAREAARRRARRTHWQSYGMLLRCAAVLGCILCGLMTYVMLTANLTSLNYALARATEHKLTLQEETQRLDDQIAHLRSRDRLADVAARLHLHDPRAYAIVDVPHPAASPNAGGIAFLGALFRR